MTYLPSIVGKPLVTDSASSSCVTVFTHVITSTKLTDNQHKFYLKSR